MTDEDEVALYKGNRYLMLLPHLGKFLQPNSQY